MFAALDPRVWAAFIGAVLLSAAISGGYGYYKGHAIATAELTAKYATVQLQAQQMADKKYQLAETKINNLSKQLASTTENKDATIQDLTKQVQDGKLHPSIVVRTRVVHDSPSTQPANSAAATASERSTETRAELMPDTFESLISIAKRGDEAILQLNTCIDTYNSVREKLK